MMKKNNIRVLAGPAPSASGTAQPFWNIAQNTEDDAEITIYGEIVTHRPTNLSLIHISEPTRRS